MDEETPTPATHKSILLADDDSFIAVAYKDGLESIGFSVSVAHDGAEALALLKSTDFDLVLMDLIMPKMNGFELLQAMKNDSKLKAIPVVVLTNLSQDSDEAEARAYGVADFMVKANVSLNDVVARAKELLQV